ncbi:MAG: excinuclease ABC subunit UvrC [Bacteroidales bacterium]|jgi:excinuclease ABC subunit C|nr:excinuclease ABC subunit UvrC [Bacteroidales bacterium]
MNRKLSVRDWGYWTFNAQNFSTLKDAVEQIVANLPEKPGVYQFLNDEGKIIYIGKAKNLRKRVYSYFHKTQDNPKVSLMVKKIADIRTILVDSEGDALLLENNLIKKYMPRYNVSLKDDKSYPWIVVRNERFPRVYVMRNPTGDGSRYFGPYTSAGAVRIVLDLVKQLYPLRSCSLNLDEENICRGKFKICLEHHLGNCKGPCEGLQNEADYNESVSQVAHILEGHISSVIRHTQAVMHRHAENFRFEEAEKAKHNIALLERYRSKSTIVNPSISNVDVFSYVDDSQCAYVNYLRIVDGAVVQAHTVEIVKRLDEAPEELLGFAIIDMRRRFLSESLKIIVPFLPDAKLQGIAYTVPRGGDMKQLLELSQRNATHFRMEKQRQAEITDPEHHEQRIMETLRRDLHLDELPEHIECFDNSNIQGTNAVAACVVFRNARPSKKDYRHFNIKTVDGPDDFASMEEVVFRRYRRMSDEGEALPQLIVIDGGKGQLGAAINSLEKLGLSGKIAVIGIAKRLEEIYFPGDSTPVYLDKRSESLRLIQHLRDEAHRFGITFHRNKRSKSMTSSELDNIKGIGEKTAQLLLQRFKSVACLQAASEEELEAVAGKRKAALVKQYFAEKAD